MNIRRNADRQICSNMQAISSCVSECKRQRMPDRQNTAARPCHQSATQMPTGKCARQPAKSQLRAPAGMRPQRSRPRPYRTKLLRTRQNSPRTGQLFHYICGFGAAQLTRAAACQTRAGVPRHSECSRSWCRHGSWRRRSCRSSRCRSGRTVSSWPRRSRGT